MLSLINYLDISGCFYFQAFLPTTGWCFTPIHFYIPTIRRCWFAKPGFTEALYITNQRE